MGSEKKFTFLWFGKLIIQVQASIFIIQLKIAKFDYNLYKRKSNLYIGGAFQTIDILVMFFRTKIQKVVGKYERKYQI